MPNNIINGIKKNFDGFLKERRSFFVALFLACLFWFSTELSKPIQYTLPVQVEYQLPQGMTFKSQAMSTLNVTFEGLGWNLFFLKSNAKKRKVLVQTQNLTSQIIGTDYYKTTIAAKFGSGKISVSKISPSQLYIELEKQATKRIPVILDHAIKLNPGFVKISDFKLIPDSITIQGAQSKLDNITYWTTERYVRNNLSQNINLGLELKSKSDSLIVLSHERINLEVEIEKATEKIIEVPIFIPPSIAEKIKVIPSAVELICQIGLSGYDMLSAENFRVELPYYSINRIKDNPNLELKVTVNNSKASNIRLNPNDVEVFLIE